MRTILPVVVALVLLATACGDGRRTTLFTATAPTPPPSPHPPFTFAEPHTTIAAGQSITILVGDDDPPCVEFPEFRCRYFRLTSPAAGMLEVVVTAVRAVPSQGQDVSIANSDGIESWGPVGGRVSVPVRGDTIYQITVWYTLPGVEFELNTSLRPD